MHQFEKLIFGKINSTRKNIYLACTEIPHEEKFGLISQIKELPFLFLRILQKALVEIAIPSSIIFRNKWFFF